MPSYVRISQNLYFIPTLPGLHRWEVSGQTSPRLCSNSYSVPLALEWVGAGTNKTLTASPREHTCLHPPHSVISSSSSSSSSLASHHMRQQNCPCGRATWAWFIVPDADTSNKFKGRWKLPNKNDSNNTCLPGQRSTYFLLPHWQHIHWPLEERWKLHTCQYLGN